MFMAALLNNSSLREERHVDYFYIALLRSASSSDSGEL